MVVWLLVAPSPARAQVVEIAPATAEAPDSSAADPKRPFSLPSQSSEATEALEDFERNSKRGAWDRAFKALEKLQQANPTGMVPAPDGFLLSVRARIWQALAGMPPAGKDAYRLFYDAEAKKLLAEAEGPAEVEKLNKVFTWYFASSVGDKAADRLGDLYFEQGDMARAADCWQSVLDHRPDSSLPRVTLLTKTAIALARSGRWRDFRAIERSVRERHAGERVTLGGHQVEAAKHVASLAPPADAEPVAKSAAPLDDLVLGATSEPLWQFRYFPESVATAIARARQDWGPQSPLIQMIPPAAVDESRVYLNMAGHHLAIDLATGKLLWRTDRYHDIAQKVQNQPYMVRTEQFGLVAADGRVYFVSRSVKELAQHNAVFRLVCLNGPDGNKLWSSDAVGDLKEWSFFGHPLVTPDRLFACAFKPAKATELNALAIDPKTGKLLWSSLIGTYKIDPNQMYYQRGPQPALALAEGKVYVETHGGALVQMSADTGTLNWAFAYDSEVPSNQGWWGYQQNTELMMHGPPLVVGGVLYSKGMRSPRLYALQVAGPKLLWQRPVSKSEMLVAIDGDRMILTGEEVTLIGLENQRLRWSTRVPPGSSEIRPVVTRTRIYQFTPRGIYELDKATGDPARKEPFRGVDLSSLGGALFRTPNALVSVSNTAVTAYPIRAAEAASASVPSGSDQKE